MKKYFSIDFPKFVRLLLPPLLRRPALEAFLDACAAPVVWLYKLFAANREANIYRLNITPQVCYLEKALNDRFDNTLRRIYITDGATNKKIFLYRRDEEFKLPVYTRTERKPVPLYRRDEYGAGDAVSFIVNVPAELPLSYDDLRALVDSYKLLCKTYVINEE